MGIYDILSSCIGRGNDALRFVKRDFIPNCFVNNGWRFYICVCPRLGAAFNQPERCFLVDSIARQLGGKLVTRKDSERSLLWGFQTFEVARLHVLLSLFALASDSNHCGVLARKIQRSNLAALQSGHQSPGLLTFFSKDILSRWKFLTLVSKCGDFFLVLFDPGQVIEYTTAKKASSTHASALAKLEKSKDGLLFVGLKGTAAPCDTEMNISGVQGAESAIISDVQGAQSAII
jgi:hypothetical protein